MNIHSLGAELFLADGHRGMDSLKPVK